MQLALRALGTELVAVGIPEALLLTADGLREQYIYSWMSIGIFQASNGFPRWPDDVRFVEKASK